ncbi:CcmD-like small membrane protein [Wolbachia endosymbiont of Dipetalonema caudispina]
MSMYVVFAYLISFMLIIGKLVFTIFCYVKSKETLEDLRKKNE